LKRPIVIAATADEEVGYGGAKAVLAHSELLKAASPKHGVIAEPTSLIPVYAHKGGTVVTVTANGVAAHTSTDRGTSANFLIAPFLAEMAEMAKRIKADPSYHRSEFDPPTVGFNMTIDDFGCRLNVTAPKSVARVGFRPMPGDRSDDITAEVVDRARHYGFDVEVGGNPPFAGSPDVKVVQSARAATGGATPMTAPYGTEAVIFQEVLEAVVLGPGSIAQAHTNGEWIALEQLYRAVDVYTRMIEDLCC
jgi:acetylornithine deacetylase